jgi:peptide/nickel transport system permease protein
VSSAGTVELVVEPEEHEAARASAWRVLVSTIEGRIGLLVGATVVFVIVFGRFLAPYPPTKLAVGPPASGPSWDNLLGTDGLGRDVLSRFLTGGDTVLVIPLIAVVLAYLVGGSLGMFAAYSRGVADVLIARTFDLLLTLPPLLIVLVIIAGLGSSNVILVVTVALVFVPRVGRVIRGATQGVIANDYVAAAQARGERTPAIIGREVLPNIAGPAIADFALRLTFAIMFISTLNFLGIGADPPSPAWGLTVAESRSILSIAPLATLAPAAGIAALAISSNLIADALTRHLTRESEGKAIL